MALRSEQYSELAAAYESAANDLFVPLKHSAAFAKKAESYRLLAKLAAKRSASSNEGAGRPESGASSVPQERAQPPINKKKTAQTEPVPSAHLQALMLLAIRWRLFRLANETLEIHKVRNRERPPARSAPKNLGRVG
jgi:hypothetical protein